MMKKTIKKLTCALLATVSVFGCAATMSACETSHPEVEMKIAFNGKTYTLDYKLYRNTAPATVSHFLWLAENGYYDELCVHDYTDLRMYTGGYAVGEDATSLVYKKYYDVIATYSNYKEFPHSIWFDGEKSNPSYTVRGEFADNNGLSVETGFLPESFGSLSMYYHDIKSDSIAKKDVHFVRSDGDGMGTADYAENSATSMFFISFSEANQTNSGYCTFATLDEDSKETLESLQDAIESYIESNYSSDQDEFTEKVATKIFEDNALFEDSSVETEFRVPKQAIVIKKVEVKKY